MAVGRGQDGFTLLEMMVVIAIVGIIAAGVAFSVSGGNERALDLEAERLRDTLQLAADQSVLNGMDIGVTLTQTGYGFLRYDVLSHHWQIYTNGAFKHHALPEPMKMSLELVLNQVPLLTNSEARTETQKPSLVFFSSGERDPFLLTLSDPAHDLSAPLGSDGVSRVSLVKKP